MSEPSNRVQGITVSAPTAVNVHFPIVLTVPGRVVDLQMKVSAPAIGDELPILLLSHGHGGSNYGSSLYGYGPLADFWAAHGFVVIQPTHLDSKTLGLDPNGPEGALFWRSRAEDMRHVVDHLDEIEATVPGLGGRLDRTRIALVGHSIGGHTVGLLAGMGVTDPVTGERADLADPRIAARVLMAPPGIGRDLATFASEHYPVLRTTTFGEMTPDALVVVGEKDAVPAFSDRADWRADAYFQSPPPKSLLTLFAAEHMLGGVSGYDAAETTDENPERVAVLRALVWAYLSTALYPGDSAWADATAALETSPDPQGRVESK